MLAKYALAEVEINKATLKKEYNFTTQGGRNKKIYTTDYLLENFPENGIRILGGKTGYTDAAKYCFVGKFIDKKGNEIITSVLGSNNMNARFEETRKLAECVFESYVWE
jgi:D-alanyl-D-alanine carboxypeptidase